MDVFGLDTRDSICAVYKITNTITGEFYIGSSVNVAKRWEAHLERFWDKDNKEYNKKLYQNIRQYGLENFKFEVVEECPKDILRTRENYYIESLNAYQDGLNCNHEGENHGKSKLTFNDVVAIREAYIRNIPKWYVFEQYKHKINYLGFDKVWKGELWNKTHMDVYEHSQHFINPIEPIRDKYEYSEEDINAIRQYKQSGMRKTDCFNLFSERMGYWIFSGIWEKV